MAGEKICFEIKAKDGRVVRLAKKRYDEHVLQEHPDLERDFEYPASEIQKAVETADFIEPGNVGQRQKYIGPVVYPSKGLYKGPRRMVVVIQVEQDNHGHVVTAFSVPL